MLILQMKGLVYRMEIKWYKNRRLMNVNQREGVTWLTYPAFESLPGVVHGFSTRLGGVSKGIYESMNLSFTRGDDEEAVRENYLCLYSNAFLIHLISSPSIPTTSKRQGMSS